MKRLICGRSFFVFWIFGCVLLLAGCQDEFSRYPSIAIPRYDEADYYRLLSDKNPEVVYDAVCNLAPQAQDIARTLADEKAARKNTPFFDRSLKIYTKILHLLPSPYPKVAAASLRFFEMFPPENAPDHLLTAVTRLRSSNPLVQYEQIVLLKLLTNPGSAVPDRLLRRFLSSPSWIVSRGAYQLIDQLERASLREELVKKFVKISDEKERLLILTALRTNFDDNTADALLYEALKTNSLKIKQEIWGMLSGARHPDRVLKWLEGNYRQVLLSGGEILFAEQSRTMEEDFSSRVVCLFLKNDFPASPFFLHQLNDVWERYQTKTDLTDADKRKMECLFKIQEAVLGSPRLATSWKALRVRSEKFDATVEQFQRDYDVLTEDFARKAARLFEQYNVPEDKKQEFLKTVKASRENLRQDLPR